MQRPDPLLKPIDTGLSVINNRCRGHNRKKLQPVGLIEPGVVVEVELYSSAVQWVQIMVGVVEVEPYSPAVQWVQMMVVVVEVQ